MNRAVPISDTELLIVEINRANARLLEVMGEVSDLVPAGDRRNDISAGLRIILRQTNEKAEFFGNLATKLRGEL